MDEGDTLLTLDTDKVSTEIPAESAGILKISAHEGDEVEIGQVVGEITEGDKPATTKGDKPEEEEEAERESKEASKQKDNAPVKSEDSEDEADELDSDDSVDKAGTLSPAVRRLVEEEDLDPADIPASGKGGRLTKGDVLSYLESRSEKNGKGASTADRAGQSPQSGARAEVEPGERTTRKPMTPLRRKIAQALVSAQNNAAHLTTFNEVDMSAVMKFRKEYQEQFTNKHGVKLGFMSFFIKATVEALKAVPQINARIDGDDLILNHYFDIGVAVGTDKGLIVPVIRDCDTKSFAQLEQDILDYADKAKKGGITLPDLQGGVFTISNGGVYGSLLSTPILNPPQSGILGMHTIQDRPVARDGEIIIRPMMYLAVSYDHRVVDGKEAVTFLVKIKECIEDPRRMLINA